MKNLLLIAIFAFFHLASSSQIIIQMKREGGVSTVPCKVNGLNLKFIFDTGASDVSISMTEANFMLKNDYLSSDDILGKANYLDANGNINAGVRIILREIEIGGLKLKNIKASVVNNMKAPLLLGQSAISQLGRVQLDLANNTLTILNPQENPIIEESIDTSALVDTAVIVENVPDEYERLYNEANEYYDQGNYKQAISKVDLILKDKPLSSQALSFRAICYDMLEDFKSAITDYSTLIRMNPNDYQALCYRGKSKYDLEDYTGALADLNRGLSINPKFVVGFKWRANTKGKLDNNVGAIMDYDRAISLDQKDSTLYVSRALYKQLNNDYAGAVIDCNMALSMNSEYAYAYFRRGVARKGLKQYKNAVDDLSKSIELDGELVESYALRASIKQDIYEDFDGALEDYNKALEIDPNYGYAAIAKAMLEQKIKENVWISVGSSSTGDKWYIYNSTVSKDYSTIKIWIKGELKSITAKKNGKPISYANPHSLMLCLFKCSEREFKILSNKNYTSKGILINEFEDGEYENWKAVTPDTVMERLFNKTCERYNN